MLVSTINPHHSTPENPNAIDFDGCEYGISHVGMIFVDDLLTAVTNEDVPILAQCHCPPCRCIHVQKFILNNTEIICDICHQPFFPADDYPDYDFHT